MGRDRIRRNIWSTRTIHGSRTEYFVKPPTGLSTFLSCRLIALNKNPGVRPIGICETWRRIITKEALLILHQDIIDAVGPRQLCAGHCAGVEAAVHSVRSLLLNESSAGALLVDASNAFNSLNRATALHNIQYLCPPIANLVINCYRSPSSLFVGGKTLI